ncbi:MAG: hypothetical protein QXR81_08430 [Candidatus Nezhaarchaeales archaeon]
MKITLHALFPAACLWMGALAAGSRRRKAYVERYPFKAFYALGAE